MSSTAQAEFAAQWRQPGDIFSILLIIGGEVIQVSLAAITGGRITPIAFSFGWVAYAISSVVSAIGESRLVLCPPEIAVRVVNLKTGYDRGNQSWLLSRFVKTYHFWKPKEVSALFKGKATSLPDEEAGRVDSRVNSGAATFPRKAALCVAVYRWADNATPGVPMRDWVWWSGFLVSILQLGVASIPWGLYGNWAVFLATVGGTILAYASASLPQWRTEKWHARKHGKDVALTLGNGSEHVIIIQGADHGLDLEDLAAGRVPHIQSTRFFCGALAILWLALLVTCTGIQTHTWYLLAVGGLGMLHNIVVAGVPRQPHALGLPIELAKKRVGSSNSEDDEDSEEIAYIFAEKKVMWTIMALENSYPGYGRTLLEKFFPGELRAWEKEWWDSSDLAERNGLLSAAREEERTKKLGKQKP